MRKAGWDNRRAMAREQQEQLQIMRTRPAPWGPAARFRRPNLLPSTSRRPTPSTGQPEPGKEIDPMKEQNTGIVMGIAMSKFTKADGEEHFRVLPGDDIQLSFPTAGAPPKIVSDKFTIVDFYESKMLEYDSMFVFMPIKELQRLRGMVDPQTGTGYVNAIEIKLRPGADGNVVRDKLKAAFAPGSTRSRPGATSKARCWRPCRWRRRSSTSCCS